jgi:amino acid adenylation domain-containing protein
MSDGIAHRLESLTPAQRALLEQRLLKRRTEVARGQAITPRSSDGPCPLSYSQELLWLLSQVFDDGVAYNAPSSFHLHGPLDLDLLARTFEALVQRHAILRTTYSIIDGRPMQIIGEGAPVGVNVVDLRDCPTAERETEAQRILKEESRFAFDLVNGPVLRLTVIRLAEDENIMMLNLHHVATDGYSRTALFRDLTVLYEALAAGTEAELPELTIQYADYAVWHREWLDSGVADAQLEYWKRQLAGSPARLDLPTDRPRPPVRSYLGDHMSTMFDTQVREGLRAAAREQDATLFVAVLAAFAALLGRYSGQDDIVIGTPFGGRSRTELDSMVGYFINPLALRVDLSGDPSFSELIARTRETTQAAFANADVPFEMVVRASNPERDLSQTPVFQAMIVYHNPAWQTERPKFEPLGIRCTEISHPKGWSKFDVLLGVSERTVGMNTTWEYSTELFEPATISRMLEHFRTFTESAATGTERRLSKLSMLSEGERARVLASRSTASVKLPDGGLVKELFEAQVKRTPDAVAVVCGEEHLTFAECNRRANRIAWLLRNRGAGTSTFVGILMEKSLELVPTLLGVIKSGAAYVPLDPAYPRERLEFIVRDARPRLLLRQARLCAAVPESDATVLDVDDPALLEGLSDEDPPTVAGGEDLAYVIYTSGSTGMPKGAMITNRGLASIYFAYEHEYRLRELTAHAQMASFSFDVFTGDVLRALLAGAKLVLCPLDVVLDPPRLYDLWVREGVDAVELVPATASVLFAYAEREGKRLDFMRFIAIGGEGWRNDQYTHFKSLCGPATRLVNSYGLTEATMDSTYYEPAPDAALVPGRFVPIGWPLPNTKVYVLDAHLEPQPIGIPGELCIAGTGVARGYLNRPQLTAERFVPDPFTEEPGARMYRTGDLARVLTDGSIEFIGRRDRQLKVRGFRVEPGEIESVLERHADVHAAAVIDYEDANGEKRLVGYVEAPKTQPPASELRSLVSRHVPNYMVPSAFVTLTKLPLTPNGKVDRNALPAPQLDRAMVADEFVAARTVTERRVAEIWAEVLCVQDVGVNDNFFALGGHSLLAMRVMSRVQEEFAGSLPLRAIFDSPTVAELAEAVDTAGPLQHEPMLVPIQRTSLRRSARGIET